VTKCESDNILFKTPECGISEARAGNSEEEKSPIIDVEQFQQAILHRRAKA